MGAPLDQASNDTFASDLEAAPLDYASRVLGPPGWNAGKHGA
jgi:hypothetical protein